ncbi:MAG: hypothetical protein HC905_00795 [Bacteroidales bacterium]|nr:hypothetical protein [Bacteroidales bacterium]
MKTKYFSVLSIIAVSMLFSACEKDENTPKVEPIAKADKINTFIWSGMHDYYLWVDKVPALTNSYYLSNEDSLNKFLNRYSDKEELFYDLLYDYNKTDKWSWIVDDYEELEKELEGITKSMGYNFMLARYGTGDKVLGYVRYVVKGAPADLAGVKRGDIFIEVNNQQLTTSNYLELLINSETYKLSFANAANGTLTMNGKTANLTAVEVTENPIYLDTVYTVNNTKIGYLVYNSFVSTYDKELNNIMLNFKNQGISKLVLDFRYNGGGSVQSAVYLASMIHGTYTDKTFLKTEYNDLVQDYLKKTYGSEYFNLPFESDIVDEKNVKTPIHSLNLSDVYIITSDNTASASESVINGLKPYINVVTVGTATYGKYVGSITIKDLDNNGNVNPNHKWAMQPIVLKIANSQGISDYVKGFTPDYELDEDITNLSVLGDLNEPLLNETISVITGSGKKSARSSQKLAAEKIGKSYEYHHKTGMFYNGHNLKLNGLQNDMMIIPTGRNESA